MAVGLVLLLLRSKDCQSEFRGVTRRPFSDSHVTVHRRSYDIVVFFCSEWKEKRVKRLSSVLFHQKFSCFSEILCIEKLLYFVFRTFMNKIKNASRIHLLCCTWHLSQLSHVSSHRLMRGLEGWLEVFSGWWWSWRRVCTVESRYNLRNFSQVSSCSWLKSITSCIKSL